MKNKSFVSLTFDVDGETLWLSKDNDNWDRPVTLSHGAYGPKVGLSRILKLLETYSIKATFFVPGWIIEKYRSNVNEIVDMGHEIAHHGYLHEYPDTLAPEKEIEILEKGIHIIQDLTGKAPVGYRSPAWEFSPQTLSLLKRYNFLYSSNMMDNDSPYRHSNGIIELPIHWSLDDAPFAMFHPRLQGRFIQPLEPILKEWKSEFYGLRSENKPIVLTMHPQIIGRVHRMKYLEKFIQYAKGFPDVEFITCEGLAKYTLDNIL